MIWGHDTDDEPEQPAPRSAISEASTSPSGAHLPVSFSPSYTAVNKQSSIPVSYNSSLDQQKSSDWSLVASRGEEQQIGSGRGISPQLPPAPSIGASSGLEHAISIPAAHKYDDKGEVVHKEKDGGASGNGLGEASSGDWWTSWLNINSF